MTKVKNTTVYKFKYISVLLCCFLLTSCSFSFVYNNADWWVNWYLDDYLSLNKDQKASFDSAFKRLHKWHRETQLPLYQIQLQTLKREVNEGITEENFNEHFVQVKTHLYTFRRYIAPDLMELSLLLTNEQKVDFITAVQDENNELSDEINDEQDSSWYKDLCKSRQSQFQKWIGKLTKEQNTMICHYTDQMTRTSMYWLQYRKNWLKAFTPILNQPHGMDSESENYAQQFSDLIIEPERFMSEEYIIALNQNRQLNVALYVHVLNNLSTAQLNTFNNRVGDFIVDLNELENTK